MFWKFSTSLRTLLGSPVEDEHRRVLVQEWENIWPLTKAPT